MQHEDFSCFYQEFNKSLITRCSYNCELSRVVREAHMDLFGTVIRLIGGVHQTHNFVKAIAKLMNESGAETLLVRAGLCLVGTANTNFGERRDYYQSLQAITVLYEAIWRLF